jgi:hypothetical protein
MRSAQRAPEQVERGHDRPAVCEPRTRRPASGVAIRLSLALLKT